MSLPNALAKIAARFDLPSDDLTAYATEDDHTGWDQGAGDWPTGSLWRVEGQVLYALIRALKPATVLELGTWHGCSATHMLAALARNGHAATLTSVDNNIEVTGQPSVIGEMIPDPLRERWQSVHDDILHFVTTTDQTYDFIFEDGFHDTPQVTAVWQAAQRLLNPGGFIVSHDAMHFIVGEGIRAGIAAAGVDDVLCLDVKPSDCGLAVWKKDGVLSEPTEKPVTKSRRKGSGARKRKSKTVDSA